MTVNPGEVEIELNGRAEVLRPTLRAAREINNACGGYSGAFKKLTEFDLSAYVYVVAAGLGKKYSEVEESVHKAGILNLTEPLARFVTILANGGKEPNPDGVNEEQKPGEE